MSNIQNNEEKIENLRAVAQIHNEILMKLLYESDRMWSTQKDDLRKCRNILNNNIDEPPAPPRREFR